MILRAADIARAEPSSETGRPDAAEPGPWVTRSAPRPPVALYLHVPFCVSACPYCDFVVYAGAAARGPRARVSAFVEAVAVELGLRADALQDAFGAVGSPGRPPLSSVYLGGGTPSLLDAPQVGRLLDLIGRRFGLAADAEVTIEVNPGPDERGDLAGSRAAGVTRVSIGAQSFDRAELRELGRRHAPADVAATATEARRVGISSVSVDLLYDLPGQTLDGWSRTLDAALDLPLDHLSAYALTLDDPEAEGLAGPNGDHLPVRPGARRWRARARAGQDDGRAAEMYALADERLTTAGLAWYEISNWARPGHESRHNLAYWHRQPYEAVGPGAHAFDGGRVRRWSAARLDGYLAALGEGRLPPGGQDLVSKTEVWFERVMLGLRLAEGIGPELVPAAREAFEWACSEGLVEAVGPLPAGRLRLTRRGRLLLDEVLARLQ